MRAENVGGVNQKRGGMRKHREGGVSSKLSCCLKRELRTVCVLVLTLMSTEVDAPPRMCVRMGAIGVVRYL